MEKIGIFIKNQNILSVDSNALYEGNPGIGGSEYQMIMLANCMQKELGDNFVCFCNKSIIGINIVLVNDELGLEPLCRQYHIKKLIVKLDTKIYDYNRLKDIKIIFWCHNFISWHQYKRLCGINNLYRCVMVSKEQYKMSVVYRKIFNKCTYIWNCFPNSLTTDNNYIASLHNDYVVFVGSVVYNKHLHLLMDVWPKVLKKIPSAVLLIIGSQCVYDINSKRGNYGISDQSYENRLMREIKKYKCESSIIFLGSLGIEKYDIISKCKVGVINPNPKNETFCLSALDIISCKVPIVCKKKYALKDTTNSRVAEYFTFKNELPRKIIKMLKKPKEINNNDLLYFTSFSVNQFTTDWLALIGDNLNRKLSFKVLLYAVFSIKRLVELFCSCLLKKANGIRLFFRHNIE